MKNQKKQDVFRLAEYQVKKNEFDGDVEVRDSEIRVLDFKSVADAKLVAKMCSIKSFGVFKIKFDKDGYCSMSLRDNERVYVTQDVIDGEVAEQKQEKRDKDNKIAAVKRINALPKTIILYKDNEFDNEFDISATRNDAATDSYHGLDVKYNIKIQYKDIDIGGWTGYVNDAGQLLKKKFAKDVYEKQYSEMLHKLNWAEREAKVANISTEYVNKRKVVLETAIRKLNEANVKINKARQGE